MRRSIPLILCAGLLTAAGAPSYSVRLDSRQCAAMPARDVAALGPGWATLAPYVQRCRVRGPNGRVAVLVDIVRLDRALEGDFFKAHAYGDVPAPVLRDAAGRVVGHLPEGFPVQPPGELKVRFTRWRGAMPQEIMLYEAGESALAPHALPSLRWDERTRSYREATGGKDHAPAARG